MHTAGAKRKVRSSAQVLWLAFLFYEVFLQTLMIRYTISEEEVITAGVPDVVIKIDHTKVT